MEKKEEGKEVILREKQIEHVNLITDILKKFPYAIDSSSLGSGKTYTSMAVMKSFEFKNLIYISTGQIIEHILPIFTEYKLPTNYLITYQGIRSTKGHQPKSRLLIRNDVKNTTTFTVNQDFINLVREGVLLVIDESQNIKNESLQYKAIKELERYIIEDKNNNSKILELSGLSVHKEDHIISLLKRFRIITQDKLIKPHYNNTDSKTGLYELISFCTQHNPLETKEILLNKLLNQYDIKMVKTLCLQLYCKVIQPLISNSMLPPVILSHVKLDIKNCYYQISEEDKKYLDNGSKNLEIQYNNNNKTMVISYLNQIEIAKINIMIRISKDILNKNSNAKVVFGLNYLKSIDLLNTALQEYSCIVLTGATKAFERAKLINLFNQPNNKCRILIANIKIINSGLNLDDRDGNYPRFVFGSPSHFFVECHQFSYRFLRGIDTKSSTIVKWIYGDSKLENSILNRMAESSIICSELLSTQVSAGIKFPGQYEDEYETSSVILDNYYRISDLIENLIEEPIQVFKPKQSTSHIMSDLSNLVMESLIDDSNIERKNIR